MDDDIDDWQQCVGVGATHDLAPGRPRKRVPIGFLHQFFTPQKKPRAKRQAKPVAKKPQRRTRRK